MERKSSKGTKTLSILMLLALGFFLMFRLLFPTIEEPDLMSLDEGWFMDGEEVSLPIYESPVVGETYSMSSRLPDFSDEGMGICFNSDNIYWSVLIDGCEVASLSEEDLTIGGTIGDRWNFVYLPASAAGKEITISMTMIYPTSSKFIRHVYFGRGTVLYQGLTELYILPLIITIVIMVLSLIYILMNEFFFRQIHHERVLTFLGIFAFVASAWAIFQNPITGMILGYHYGLLSASYILFGLTFAFMMEYYIRYQKVTDRRLIILLPGVYYFLTAVMLIGDLTSVFPYAVSVSLVRIVLVLTVGYILVDSGLRFMKEHTLVSGKPLLLVGNLILAFTGMWDIIRCFSIGANDYCRNTRVGMLIYMIFVGIHEFILFLEYYHRVEETNTMEQLAYKDGLTGIGNRMAFNHRLELLPAKKYIGFVHFDVNNLKSTNDSYGHLEGDKLLKIAADCIQDSFKNIGRVYRYGGDEFTVILEQYREKDIKSALNNLEEAVDKINAENERDWEVAIAYGYTNFDSKLDKNLLNTLDRADGLMYVCKKHMKEKAETK